MRHTSVFFFNSRVRRRRIRGRATTLARPRDVLRGPCAACGPFVVRGDSAPPLSSTGKGENLRQGEGMGETPVALCAVFSPGVWRSSPVRLMCTPARPPRGTVYTPWGLRISRCGTGSRPGSSRSCLTPWRRPGRPREKSRLMAPRPRSKRQLPEGPQ